MLLAASALALVVAATRRPQPPHIVLISVDTLRADHLGAYGYQQATSPFLDQLADKGLLFENAYVPLPATGPSHASLLTSVVPEKHGVTSNGLPLLAITDTLAAALHRAGYHTAGVVAVSHIGRRVAFSRGFDAFFGPENDTTQDIRIDADRINQVAREVIDAHAAASPRQPLFLFVHYFDCHYPYRWWDHDQTENPWKAEVMSDRAKQLVRYDDGVRRVDQHIRQLVQEITAKLGNNVVFCVTADHGEQIGDHGLAVGHADIYRETVAVPLILRGPGVPSQRISAPVSTMDVGVTLTALAGARFANFVDGENLLATAERARSWFQHLFGSEPERSLAVTGTPAYTRSVALIGAGHWYIKNFDYVYRYGWIQSPAPAEPRPGTVVAAGARGGDRVSYAIPFRRYQPYLLSIEHVAKNADCAMTAMVSLAPNLDYYDAPIPFRRSIRLTVPAGRLDAVKLIVSPAACAGRTTYRVLRFEDGGSLPLAARRETSLFSKLLVTRKSGAMDELFPAEDRAMLVNLAGTTPVASFDQKLRTLYKKIASAPAAEATVSAEEQKRLRSLGYLQ